MVGKAIICASVMAIVGVSASLFFGLRMGKQAKNFLDSLERQKKDPTKTKNRAFNSDTESNAR